MRGGFQIRSRLLASRETVWQRVRALDGVNDELFPFVRMTGPPRGIPADIARAPIGVRAFRSWLLLFGLVPVEFDDLTLVRVDDGYGFLESSTMLSLRTWQHERVLADDGPACLITDRLSFEPRFGVPAPAVRAIVRALFTHRHRRLITRFGGRIDTIGA